MNKKLFIVAIAVLVVGAATFLLFQKEDPLVTQAKTEVRSAKAVLTTYQNTINSIPSLELSSDVENDLKMEAAFLGVIGYLNPGDPGHEPRMLLYGGKLTTAANARAHPQVSVKMEEFDKMLETIATVLPGVAREDIKYLERQADVFDEGVERAGNEVPALASLTVARNKKMEKYFLEFDRIDQQLTATAAALDKYSSADFRARLAKLNSANKIFEDLATYTKLLVDGKAWGYSLDVAALFPEVQAQENALKLCWQRPGSCQPVGPFPGEQYQIMFQKLEPLYAALIED